MSSPAPMPTLDVVIAVHDPRRDIVRAVSSVLADGIQGVRVIVVCHGIPTNVIASKLPPDGDRVNVVEFRDGVRSPAGPFNEGIRHSDADYVMVMGSDDFLQPGAVAAWLAAIARAGADVLIVEQAMQTGVFVPTPLVRVGRAADLDVVRDRLFTRSAPLALIRRSLIGALMLSFTTGMATGEDLDFSARLWVGASRIDLARALPRYVVGTDASTRVTQTAASAATILEPIRLLATADWSRGLPAAVRRSLAVKLWRTHIIATVLARPSPADWDDDDLVALAVVSGEVLRLSPAALHALSIADRRLIEQLEPRGRQAPAIEHVVAASERRARAGRVVSVLPRNPLRWFDRESALTRYLVYFLDRRRARVTDDIRMHR